MAMLAHRQRMPNSVLARAAEAPALALRESVQFKVRYALPEYVSFMWQHGAFLIRRRQVGAFTGSWLQIKSTALAALHFVALGRARRVYEFTIDEHGIVRVCGTGVTLVRWDQVDSIRRYSCGYMMMLERGTLPIPFRCLDSAQRAAMDSYV